MADFEEEEEFGNDDYYAILNVRKEVNFIARCLRPYYALRDVSFHA